LSPHLLRRVIVLTAASEQWMHRMDKLESVWCVRRKPLDIDDLSTQMRLCAAAAGVV
jgi:hypothetical protein